MVLSASTWKWITTSHSFEEGLDHVQIKPEVLVDPDEQPDASGIDRGQGWISLMGGQSLVTLSENSMISMQSEPGRLRRPNETEGHLLKAVGVFRSRTGHQRTHTLTSCGDAEELQQLQGCRVYSCLFKDLFCIPVFVECI